MKESPFRKCVACNQMISRNHMLRVVKTKEGKIFVDISQKADGRGAYVCKSTDCLLKAITKKGFNRSLSCQIPSEVYEEMERLLKDEF